jgi:hypothetical protein
MWCSGFCMRRLLLAAGLAAVLSAGASLAAPVATPGPVSGASLASHRAIYNLALTKVGHSESVRAVKGTMTYTLTDRCDGYTIESNILMDMAFASGADNQVDQRYAAWEAKDGRTATFRMQLFENGSLAKAYTGDVHLKEDGSGKVTYESNALINFDLPPGTLLSTAHSLALLRSAAAGERFLSRTVIDGSFEEGPFLITAALSPARKASDPKSADISADVVAGSYWPVELAYFSLQDGKETPDYEVMMNMLGNGVTRSMSQDMGGFTLGFDLVRIEPVPGSKC